LALFAASAAFLSPAMPAAQAAIADDVLSQLAARYPASEKVQEILALKQEYDRDGKDALVRRVARAAFGQTGQGELTGAATAAIAAAADTDLRSMVEAKMKQEVEYQLADKLAPYSDRLALLAQMMVSYGLDPRAIGGGDYRQLLTKAAAAYLSAELSKLP